MLKISGLLPLTFPVFWSNLRLTCLTFPGDVGCFGSTAAVCTLQLLRAFNDVFLPVSVGCLCKLLDFFGRGGVTTEVWDEASDKEDEGRSNKQLSHPSSMVCAASNWSNQALFCSSLRLSLRGSRLSQLRVLYWPNRSGSLTPLSPVTEANQIDYNVIVATCAAQLDQVKSIMLRYALHNPPDQRCRSDKHHLHDDGMCTHVHCVSLNASMLWPLQPLLPTCNRLNQSSDKINMVWYAQPVKNRERMGMACCYANLQFVFRPCWASTCVMLSLHLVSQCGWDMMDMLCKQEPVFQL